MGDLCQKSTSTLQQRSKCHEAVPKPSLPYGCILLDCAESTQHSGRYGGNRWHSGSITSNQGGESFETKLAHSKLLGASILRWDKDQDPADPDKQHTGRAHTVPLHRQPRRRSCVKSHRQWL